MHVLIICLFNFLFFLLFFQPPPLQAPQQTAAPSHANHCNSCYRLPCFPLVRSRLLVTSWTIRMGRFKKGGSKPACKLKLSSGELKFITDHTSFTEDHIKEWHKVNRLYINKAGWPIFLKMWKLSIFLRSRYKYAPCRVSWRIVLMGGWTEKKWSRCSTQSCRRFHIYIYIY